ncbi:MAG: hypothetical protein JSS81_24280 [Acidobacteria bacterium]|nr:hypothetical protein [Acidobacteriota bacterium]
MKDLTLINSFRQRHRFLIRALQIGPLEIKVARRYWKLLRRLEETAFIEYSDDFVSLSAKGKELTEKYAERLFRDVPEDRDTLLVTAFKKPEKDPVKKEQKEILFLRFLERAPRATEIIRGAGPIIPRLLEKNWIRQDEGVYSLTETGAEVLKDRPPPEVDPDSVYLAALRQKQREKLQNKGDEFMTLYCQGLTLEKISRLHNLTRERVRHILKAAPNYEERLAAYKQEKIERRNLKEAERKLKRMEKNLGARFPEQIARMWDRKKNRGLDPLRLRPGSNLKAWFICPEYRHSWLGKIGSVVRSWMTGTSGCPVCAGRLEKPKKQKTLTEAFPEMVEQFWSYEKNELDPQKLTLGSNRMAWFLCRRHDYEWHSPICLTVYQSWKQERSGCRVCSKLIDRLLPYRNPRLMETYPAEIARLWDYPKNEMNLLDPARLTIHSSHYAWYRCPVDGFEWVTRAGYISKLWKAGKPGCPVCRGARRAGEKSLRAGYPEFVADLWWTRKNKALGLLPEVLLPETRREAWFRCPKDGTKWFSSIRYLVNNYWKKGRNGCPVCEAA